MIKQRIPCHANTNTTLKASFFTNTKTFISNPERRNFTATFASAKSSPIFVAGADGVIALRIVKKLLDSGYKVSAGVKDEERAEMLLNFMKQYGILKKPQLSNLSVSNLANKEGAIASKIPNRSAKVICIEGDVIGRQTTDLRYISNVIEACQDKNVSELAFVTSKSSSGGGGFFSFFTGGNASGTSLSRTEKIVADSGINYTIIRSSNTNVPDSFGEISNVVVGQQGAFKSGQITKNQVADTVESVLNCEYTDFVMEIKGDVSAENVPIESQISNLFQEDSSLEAATANTE